MQQSEPTFVTVRRSLNQSSPSDQDRAGPSELQSFSESLKSRLNAVSTRYPVSLSLSLATLAFVLIYSNLKVIPDAQ